MERQRNTDEFSVEFGLYKLRFTNRKGVHTRRTMKCRNKYRSGNRVYESVLGTFVETEERENERSLLDCHG